MHTDLVDEALRLPSPCVVVLVGPGASGKSTWAAEHFPADAIVSSDRLRALVGAGEDDVAAGADAFALLEDVTRRRLARRLTTVIDTLGLDAERRRSWLELARRHGLPCVAVGFDTPAAECRARNRQRSKRIPSQVLTDQLRTWARTRELLPSEGYDLVLAPQPVRVVPEAFVAGSEEAPHREERPAGLRFGLHVGSFTLAGGTRATAARLREIAQAAEAAGFDAIYVMDHFRQIPQVGRAWEDFLESYTTLAYLAACTERVRLGALVTGITYRNVAHLGKIVASLDVLTGGRAVCGLGLAWFRDEHVAYGWTFPSRADRYALLEDALRLLPVLWGPGNPAFSGTVLNVPDTTCYPRPLQSRIPLLVGGGGERRTLRLAARYADASNVFGDAAAVRHKASVLRAHCEAAGRDPASVALTHLGTVLVGDDDAQVASLVERLRPRQRSAAWYAASVSAGTVADHVGRFRSLAAAGASEVMVRLADLSDAGPVERMGRVISAVRSGA
ncbi:MAG: TIGR03560 family F420-dependent LLM class oxidoreductase [Candidatus Dormibacteraeota bacterium]|nr:TIGR03560 family F420-dependent LLM class oxidoreductase [Candidatus Dormibacteraeota bacterium]MBO0759951.1 TIGR03560 family F420-dependent LLM class oxidoreductase [Candidatus Dormibacteraeota bacterium]